MFFTDPFLGFHNFDTDTDVDSYVSITATFVTLGTVGFQYTTPPTNPSSRLEFFVDGEPLYEIVSSSLCVD